MNEFVTEILNGMTEDLKGVTSLRADAAPAVGADFGLGENRAENRKTSGRSSHGPMLSRNIEHAGPFLPMTEVPVSIRKELLCRFHF